MGYALLEFFILHCSVSRVTSITFVKGFTVLLTFNASAENVMQLYIGGNIVMSFAKTCYTVLSHPKGNCYLNVNNQYTTVKNMGDLQGIFFHQILMLH